MINREVAATVAQVAVQRGQNMDSVHPDIFKQGRLSSNSALYSDLFRNAKHMVVVSE
jgi:hypothetical protein